MELWTDYEGRTVAGEYTLLKLRRSEGRNGFFATTDASGAPKVIRLTEPHYDEEDQLHRWRTVAEMKHPSLIAIERVGRTDLDDGGERVDLTYALMEADDAVLSSVLAERPLTPAETLQVATSVSSAMAALHARNLVHEHLTAENVMAVGETVKLRSDRVRECVEDGEFVSPEQVAATRAKDLHDFGTLLLLCLTQDAELKPGLRLPEPFQRIIPESIEGSTTFARLAATLAPPPAVPPSSVAAAVAAANAAAASSAAETAASAAAPTAAGTSAAMPVASPAVTGAGAGLSKRAPTSRPVQRPLPLADPVVPHRVHGIEDEMEEFTPEKLMPPFGLAALTRNWAVWTAAALVVIFLVWHFAGGRKSAKSAPAAVQAALASADTTSSAASKPAPPVIVVERRTKEPVLRATPQLTTSTAAAVNAAATPAPAASGSGWHVIAYTFFRQDQAQTRANAIAAKHPQLNPQVYSPSGAAPFLVSLGGPLDERSAQRLVRIARRQGMPRDTFARNFRRD